MHNKIKEYMKSRGIKQMHVSTESGIEQAKLSRILNGDQMMKIEEYELICRKGLQVSPAYFYKEE